MTRHKTMMARADAQLRAARMIHLAQRAQAAGQWTRARRLATAARIVAGLDPVGG